MFTNGEVLVVGLTSMKIGVCVGGIDLTNKCSVRLQPFQTGLHYSQQDNWEIGKFYQVEYFKPGGLPRPHTEDIRVVKWGLINSYRSTSISDATKLVSCWSGPITQIFDGYMEWTASGAGYISRNKVCDMSTGFWRPNRPLVRDRFGNFWADGTSWNIEGRKFKLKCVALDQGDIPDIIPKNTLLRISLSRWYQPDNLPDGCWLQLSGLVSEPNMESHATVPDADIPF